MTTRAARHHDPRQEELALSTLGSLASHSLFPGRTTLYIREVADALATDSRHIINLIEEFELTGGQSGLKGFSIAREKIVPPDAKGTETIAAIRARLRATPRNCWRVAVSDFDAFFAKRRTSHI